MRQLVMTAGGPRVVQTPAPTVQPNAVLVRVLCSAVSPGTETAGLRAPAGAEAGRLEQLAATAATGARYFRKGLLNPRKAARRLSQIAAARLAPEQGDADGLAAVGSALGYSLVGIAVETGAAIDDIAVGDRVACAGAGEAGHAEFVRVRRNLLVKVPPDVADGDAATVTLGAIALQAVRRANLQLGERVAVIGLGILGQMAERMARAAGCLTIGMDLNDNRVDRALQAGMTAGATTADSLGQRIEALTGRQGADVVIVAAASRNRAVVNLAMAVARPKGRVVLLGDVGLDIDRDAFYRKELDLLMSTSYGPGRYDAAYEDRGQDYPPSYVRWTMNRNMQAYLELIERGAVGVGDLIDSRVPIEEAPALYRSLAKGGVEAPIGVLLDYRPADDASVTLRLPKAALAADDGAIGTALVGVGNFGEAMLLPAIRASADLSLRCLVGRDPVRVANAGRTYRVPAVTTDFGALLDDPAIAAIVIATRHDTHADLARRALQAGRHVFVEKPLALDWPSLDALADWIQSSGEATPVLTVGFNRRFCDAAAAVRGALEGRKGPVVMHYRVNAGPLPADHWVHGPQGGGRNIGEACHMYDLCRHLVGAPVESVVAAGATARSNENFSATIRYADGSIATVTYTSLGSPGVEKERLEIFCEGQVLTLHDFKQVTGSRDGELYRASAPEKGHRACVAAFAAACRTGRPPIALEEIFETTALALHIEEML